MLSGSPTISSAYRSASRTPTTSSPISIRLWRGCSQRLAPIAPVEHFPTLRLRQPHQPSVRVGRDRFVREAVAGDVGDMVRIEADVHRVTVEALALEPGLDHVALGGAVAIGAVDPRGDASLDAAHGIGGDDVVEAEPPRDRG